MSSQPIPPSGPSRNHWTPKRVTILTISLVAMLIFLSLGWWLVSPLFFSARGSDNNPFVRVSVSPTAVSPRPEANDATRTQEPTSPAGGPVVLARGSFVDMNDGIHHGEGEVTIGKTGEGTYVLFLDELNVTNGPDLYIYLSASNNPTNHDQVTQGGFNLGHLTATQGSVRVDIPTDAGQNLQNYESVVIYCQAFSVIFTTAPLKFSA